MLRNFLMTSLLLLIAACGQGEQQSKMADVGLVYVHAGHLIDVEQGMVLDDRLIVIKGERIIDVKPWTEEAALSDVIDWSAYTVMPGMIDGHTHLVGDIQSEDVLAPLKISFDEDVAMGEVSALKTLEAGFTTVIDVGVYQVFTDVALRDKINSGEVPGPRMMVAGAYITKPWGGGEVVGKDAGVDIPPQFRAGVVTSPEEVREKVRYLLDGGADFIKLIATGAVLTVGTEPGEPELSEEEMRAAVEEAAKRGKYVTAHAHGAEGIKMAVRAGVRSIQHGSLADEEALQMMKEHGTWLVADIYNGDYINDVGTREGWPEETMRKNRETTDTQRAVFRRAVELGVNIAYGTDSGVYPHGDNAKQMPYMVRYGLSPMQAIQSATIWGARSMSLEKDVGSIAPGKYADMIAVSNEVLEDVSVLEHVDAVMKGGKLVP